MSSGAYSSLSEPDGRDREQELDAERLHREDVGLEVELVRQDAVPAPVARQERDRAALELAQHQAVRGLAERRVDRDLARRRVKPSIW